MERTENHTIKVKSLAKAIDVLGCFIEQPEWGVTELSGRLSLHKSNVHNILATYETLGYLEQEPATGKYRLGLKIFELSRALGDRFTVRQVAIPFLQELANETQMRVYLAIPREDEALYLEAAYPADDYSLFRSLMGVRAKMYCTSIGKAMLAYLPPALQREYAARPLLPFTENTITSPECLHEELARVRACGYAVDNMEHEYGIKCVGVPVFERSGAVIAAISISGVYSPQYDDARVERFAALLKAKARLIQERI